MITWRLPDHGGIVVLPATPPEGAKVEVMPDRVLDEINKVVSHDPTMTTVHVRRGEARWFAWLMFKMTARSPKNKALHAEWERQQELKE